MLCECNAFHVFTTMFIMAVLRSVASHHSTRILKVVGNLAVVSYCLNVNRMGEQPLFISLYSFSHCRLTWVWHMQSCQYLANYARWSCVDHTVCIVSLRRCGKTDIHLYRFVHQHNVHIEAPHCLVAVKFLSGHGLIAVKSLSGRGQATVKSLTGCC